MRVTSTFRCNPCFGVLYYCYLGLKVPGLFHPYVVICTLRYLIRGISDDKTSRKLLNYRIDSLFLDFANHSDIQNPLKALLPAKCSCCRNFGCILSMLKFCNKGQSVCYDNDSANSICQPCRLCMVQNLDKFPF